MDVHPLALAAIGIDGFFIHHNLFDQLVEDMGIQFRDIGLFPDNRQEFLNVVVNLFAACNLGYQLFPLDLQ